MTTSRASRAGANWKPEAQDSTTKYPTCFHQQQKKWPGQNFNFKPTPHAELCRKTHDESFGKGWRAHSSLFSRAPAKRAGCQQAATAKPRRTRQSPGSGRSRPCCLELRLRWAAALRLGQSLRQHLHFSPPELREHQQAPSARGPCYRNTEFVNKFFTASFGSACADIFLHQYWRGQKTVPSQRLR